VTSFSTKAELKLLPEYRKRLPQHSRKPGNEDWKGAKGLVFSAATMKASTDFKLDFPWSKKRQWKHQHIKT